MSLKAAKLPVYVPIPVLGIWLVYSAEVMRLLIKFMISELNSEPAAFAALLLSQEMDSTPLRRCRTPACTMASYLVQDSGYCSKCEQREDPRQWAFSEDRDMRRGASFQEPVKDSPSAIHQRKPSFNEGLSPAYKRHSRLANDMQSPLLPPAMESRPGLAASSYVSNLSLQSRSQQAPRRSDHGALQGRDMVVTANNFQFQMPTEQSLTGSMPAQQQASYYRGLVSNAGLSRLFPSAATPPAPPSGPQVRPTSRMMLRASPSMREAPSGPSQVTQSVRRSRSAGFPPSGELRRGSRSPYTLARPAPERSANRISFAAEPAKPTPGCQTPNCGAASYLIQANGFCTACNTKVSQELASLFDANKPSAQQRLFLYDSSASYWSIFFVCS